MPILLFILWLVFNERITSDVIIAGVIVVALLSLFLAKFTGWSVSRDMKFAARIPAFIGFVLRLIVEVFKANIHMIALVLSDKPNEIIAPKIVKHKTPLNTSVGRVALANSITLTPGTITLDIVEENGRSYYYVHWIDVKETESEKAGKAIKGTLETWIRRIWR